MEENDWKKRRRRLPDMETFNRDDHWERHFTVRNDVWPVIEHWAAENDYHLVAIKGKRRLYQKGENTNWFANLVDVKHDGRSVTLSSWIHVGWIPRALSLYIYPENLEIMPDGYVGIVRRRRACHNLNELLFRLKQPDIIGSSTFHVADLDFTTLCLFGLIAWPQVLFLAHSGVKMEIRGGLSRELLIRIGESWGILLAVSIALLITHHKYIVRKLKVTWMKWTSVGVGGMTFAVLAILLLTRTSSLMAQDKVLYYCLYRLNQPACDETLNRLSPKEQQFVMQRLNQLQQELAISPRRK